MGEHVRYDGSNKNESIIIDDLRNEFQLVPVCPEVGAGLGVPRPPVRLVRTPHGIRMREVDDGAIDITDALLGYSREVMPALADLSGFILKARSPSCGILDTDIFDEADVLVGSGAGLFVRVLQTAYPTLPIINEEYFREGGLREIFLERVRVHHNKLYSE